MLAVNRIAMRNSIQKGQTTIKQFNQNQSKKLDTLSSLTRKDIVKASKTYAGHRKHDIQEYFKSGKTISDLLIPHTFKDTMKQKNRII